MIVARQGLSFLMVGCGLVVVDWGVFVGLSALGMHAPEANVSGRVVGALVGFSLNGGITFRQNGTPRYGLHRFLRYLALWIGLTILSTALVTQVADHASLHRAWAIKPLVEAALGVVSFFACRHWVYR
jgi:putative flippase GtrA